MAQRWKTRLWDERMDSASVPTPHQPDTTDLIFSHLFWLDETGRVIPLHLRGDWRTPKGDVSYTAYDLKWAAGLFTCIAGTCYNVVVLSYNVTTLENIKWNKADFILYIIVLYEYSQYVSQKQIGGISCLGGETDGEYLLSGYRTSFGRWQCPGADRGGSCVPL